MRPQTSLLNDFRLTHRMTITDLSSSMRELAKLFGPDPYVISRRRDIKSYNELSQQHNEQCEACRKSPPEVQLVIASRSTPITKETELKDLRLLCTRCARVYRKSVKEQSLCLA